MPFELARLTIQVSADPSDVVGEVEEVCFNQLAQSQGHDIPMDSNQIHLDLFRHLLPEP